MFEWVYFVVTKLAGISIPTHIIRSLYTRWNGSGVHHRCLLGKHEYSNEPAFHFQGDRLYSTTIGATQRHHHPQGEPHQGGCPHHLWPLAFKDPVCPRKGSSSDGCQGEEVQNA